MAFDEKLAARIRRSLAGCNHLEARKMFGGIAFLLDGHLLVGVWNESLVVRVGPDVYDDALAETHVREFDITGKAMKGWVLVEPGGIEDDELLDDWIARAMHFVESLPAKWET